MGSAGVIWWALTDLSACQVPSVSLNWEISQKIIQFFSLLHSQHPPSRSPSTPCTVSLSFLRTLNVWVRRYVLMELNRVSMEFPFLGFFWIPWIQTTSSSLTTPTLPLLSEWYTLINSSRHCIPVLSLLPVPPWIPIMWNWSDWSRFLNKIKRD
jgi:hypothetical protein